MGVTRNINRLYSYRTHTGFKGNNNNLLNPKLKPGAGTVQGLLSFQNQTLLLYDLLEALKHLCTILFDFSNQPSDFFPASQVTVGLSVFQTLQTIRPDWVVLGISDIHPEKGLTCPDREEAMIKRCMIEQGIRRVVLADSYKLDTARTYHVASLADIDYIVTEDSKVDYIKQYWPKYSYEVI